MRKKCKKISNIEKIFLARFAHSAFYKIHISGASNRHSEFNMQNMLLFFSKQSSWYEPFTSFVSFS